ncbi:MAG: BatD family protein [Verrucomicrobiota bacterium]
MKKLGLLFLLTMLAIAGLGSVQAADPKVEAVISDNNVAPGDQVELQIKITGASSVKPPERLSVDGLTVGGVSQSTQRSMSIINGSYSSTETTIFSFPIIAQKAGTYTIPALTVEADGKKITTRPLQLTVSGNGPASGGVTGGGVNPDDQGGESNNQIAEAELIVPKQSVYLGETVPVELRIYFYRKPTQIAPPQIQMDGFTTQKLTNPAQDVIQRHGQECLRLNFKTTITPVKTGKLSLGPAEMQYVAVVEVKRKTSRTQQRDPFAQLFGNPFAMMNTEEQRQLMVRSGGVDIEVKPLPQAGKPKSFSGAVGMFKLETNASPLKVAIGDPLTMKMKISGRGNFDRVNAPQMLDESGWRSYSPSSKFTPEDDAGISGVKTFEMALIPQEKKSALPVMEFSYFDPLTAKYVTLSSKPEAITVEGQNPPLMAQNSPAQPSGPTPSPTPQGKQKTDDLFYISDASNWGESFDPVYTTRTFWLTQIVPALGLMAFVGLKLRNARKNNVQAIRLAELQKAKNETLKVLNRTGTGYTDFFEAAVKYLQFEAARTTGRDPASISPGDAIAARALDPAIAEDIHWIFNTCAEQRYTGGAGSAGNVPDGKRAKVLETIKKYENL